jgi:uncharacterized C2H2 Zn-finger protein
MGVGRRLRWYGETLAVRVARFVGCLDDLSNMPALKAVLMARGKRLAANCSEKYLRCPVCNFVYSRRGLWRHVYNTHYNEILQALDEWQKQVAEKRT